MFRRIFNDNYTEIVKEAFSFIKKEGQRLSEVVELKNYPDNYFLPKAILVIALENCINQFNFNPKSLKRLHGKEILEEIEKIRHF